MTSQSDFKPPWTIFKMFRRLLRQSKSGVLWIFALGYSCFCFQVALQIFILTAEQSQTPPDIRYRRTSGPVKLHDVVHQQAPTERYRDSTGSPIERNVAGVSFKKSPSTVGPRVFVEQHQDRVSPPRKIEIKLSPFEIRTRAREFNVDGISYEVSSRARSANDNYNACVSKSANPETVTLNGTARTVPFWQRKLRHCGRLGHVDANGTWGLLLGELLQVRIYDQDLSKWSIRELKQWLHFMFLAGVDHVFICDHYKNETERLDIPLKRYIEMGLVTYYNWSAVSDIAIKAQVECYKHVIERHNATTMWNIAVDMDEYPVSPNDTSENFLVRYLDGVTRRSGPRLSEISMPNYLMLGQGNGSRDIASSRINRIATDFKKNLVKPIFRPTRVVVGIHRNEVIFGKTLNSEPSELRMLHFWGKRLQEWGPDTPKVLNMTRESDFMQRHWEQQIRNSLLVFGEFDAFSNLSGP